MKEYLKQRGFDNEIIKAWKLEPGTNEVKINYLDPEGNLLYKRRNRPGKEPKYISPSSDKMPGGHSWLYGLHMLKYVKDTLLIVEGEYNCISAWSMDRCALGVPGQAMSLKEYHLKDIPDTVKKIKILCDDPKFATERAKEVLKYYDWQKEVYIAQYPDNKDANDYLKEGRVTDFQVITNMAVRYFEDQLMSPDIKVKIPEAGKGKKDSKEKKGKKEKIKTLIPGLIHLVKESETVAYLLQNSGKFYIKETYTLEDGTVCRPKQDLPIHCCGLDIVEEPRNINYEDLLEEIINFIKSCLEMPEETDYLILALWVFHTYVIEKFETTPIIYFQGVKETGKTRAGEVLEYLSYKCERLASPTEATLFRSAEYFKTSLIVDEIHLWGKEGNREVGQLIKSRYKRGLKVSRIDMNKKGEDQVEYFDVFAPLVISTTESIPAIIESRCISFLMQKNKDPGVERFIDKELARKIRNKLTVFRANFMDQKLKEVGSISRRRLNELLNPLYQVLMEVAPDRENEFKLISKSLEQIKEIEEEFTIEAEVVEAVVENYNETGEMTFLTAEITNRLNDEKSEKDLFSSRFIGRCLVSLGFKKKRLINGKRGFNFKLSFLNNLITQYKIKNSEPQENLFES